MTKANSTIFKLPALPFEENALAPIISARTLQFHYGKHHQAYVEKLNEGISETEFADMRLEEIIASTAGQAKETAIFNNAAQVWNHTFYWNSLSPKGGSKPLGELGRKIQEDFGSFEEFALKFIKAGTSQFGSGWLWLVEDAGHLEIVSTSNAENPMSQGIGKALITLDVWEHAYYLDYQNRRKEYLTAVLDKLINWEFAGKNYSR